MMKTTIFFISFYIMACAGEFEKLFDPNSIYSARGQMNIGVFNEKDFEDLDQNYNKYNLLFNRTVAVNPKIILPGSLVFIPALVGAPLASGTFHDGYFFAHALLKSRDKKINIFTNNDDSFAKYTGEMDVFEVNGTIAKSLRTRYQLQYIKEEIVPTYRMVASQFNELMQQSNQQLKDIKKRVQYYSERGKGTPYLIFNLGEGAGSYPDPDPTIDFARTDCMTFCEHTLALAISDNYQDMYTNLQKIRYKNGQIDYVSRNHYTIVDWLPNNNWLLDDITAEVGAGFSKKMTKTIDRPEFYKKNGVPEDQLSTAPPKKKLTVDYIPTKNLLSIKDKLQGGEIVSIVTTHPAVFSAHMGIIIRDEWDNLIFRHASSSDKTGEVMDERFENYVANLEKSKSRVGMIFMRPKNNYQIPQ